jgi:hypothetical protein
LEFPKLRFENIHGETVSNRNSNLTIRVSANGLKYAYAEKFACYKKSGASRRISLCRTTKP